MLRKVRLPTPDNVGNGSRFTVKLPVGPTYAGVMLVMAGTFTPAMIANLEFSINGRAVRRYALGSHLDKLNQRMGIPAAATNRVLQFWFRRNELEEIEDAEMFDIGTARPDPMNPADRDSPIIESLTITGDVSGASNPVLTAYALQSSKIRPLRMLTKVMYYPKTFTVSTGGTEGDFDAFPIGYPNSVMLGMHAVEAVDDTITHVALTANIGGASTDIIQNAPVAVLKNADEGAVKPKVWQSGMVHVDLIESGQVADGLPLGACGDLRARLTCLHASNTTELVHLYTDVVDTFQGV